MSRWRARPGVWAWQAEGRVGRLGLACLVARVGKSREVLDTEGRLVEARKGMARRQAGRSAQRCGVSRSCVLGAG